MAKLEADLTMNVRQFVAEAKKAGTSLEDIVREYDDIADESARTERDVVADLKRISRQAKDTGDDLDKEVGGGFRDLKDEARQSGAEAAQSFSGEFSDVGDFLQESIAQGLSGFGPIGTAAGIALAAGIGVALGEVQKFAEASEQRISDMYQAMLDQGSAFVSQQIINDAVKQLADDTGKWNEALETAEDTGLSVQTILRALVGDQEAINAAIDAANRKRDEEIAKVDTNSKSYELAVARINEQYDGIILRLETVSRDTDTAANKARAVTGALSTSNAVLDEGIRKVQNMRAELDKLGTGKSIRLDVIPNMTEFERVIGLQKGRTITLNVQGQVTRIGNQVW